MTKLLYLDDTYISDGTGVVQAIGADEKGVYFILDQTIFYPQGGGQPSDKGSISIGGDETRVVSVGYHEGEVRHYVPDGAARERHVGQEARFSIDQVFRISNARRHTGGHLISHVLESINSNLIPIKGFHFPEGAYVEFLNEHGVDLNLIIEEGNARLASDVAAGLSITAALSDYSTISELRPELAPFVPRGKPSRIVTIGEYISLPCGGTHVKNLTELGQLRITKFKKQKSNIRVSYQLCE